MIDCLTVAEAYAVPNVIHIELGTPVKAWQSGDTLPGHLLPGPEPTAEEASQQAIDENKPLKALVIRIMELRLGRSPSAAELRAERDRIAAIYRNL